MNRHLYNQNEDVIHILQDAEKQFPKVDVGTTGIPLDADPTLWQLSIYRAAGARAAFEWMRDRFEASLKIGYEPAAEPEAQSRPGVPSVVDYLEEYQPDVLEAEDPESP